MAAGLVERIGLPGLVLNHRPADKEKTVIAAEVPDHHVAIRLVLDALFSNPYSIKKETDSNIAEDRPKRIIDLYLREWGQNQMLSIPYFLDCKGFLSNFNHDIALLSSQRALRR